MAAKKVYEFNNLVLNTSDITTKYNVNTLGNTPEKRELPISLKKIHKFYMGRLDHHSCQDAYDEIHNINRT